MNVCRRCQRGREACAWCENVDEADWRAMCDCGLLDFDAHLLDCEARTDRRYVIAVDHGTASLPRFDSANTSSHPRRGGA